MCESGRAAQNSVLLVDTMNWRRGFLRLWVVFSLLWLLACGAWGLYQWHAGIVARFPVTDPSGLKFVVIAPVGAAKADILYFVRNSDAVKRWQANCSKERSAVCKKEIRVQMPGIFESVVQFLVFTISVPVLTLTLGLVLGWVILGFRKPMVPTS
jgi:hypothetical protein